MEGFNNRSNSNEEISVDFNEAIGDPQKLRSLVEGSHVYNNDETCTPKEMWQEWERARRFITLAINKDGSFLDYGSANGLLLKSLQVWSPYKIDPYGLDIDKKAIEKAKELFPNQTDHFVTPEDAEIAKNFPKNFDFVYWNVWDNYEIRHNDSLIKKLKGSTNNGGRLILGFYESKESNKKKIEQLITLGFKSSQIIENPAGGDEMIVWFD